VTSPETVAPSSGAVRQTLIAYVLSELFVVWQLGEADATPGKTAITAARIPPRSR
jgi:hypothetical protein